MPCSTLCRVSRKGRQQKADNRRQTTKSRTGTPWALWGHPGPQWSTGGVRSSGATQRTRSPSNS
eukprot:7117549-Prymnesium_polylepis.1